MDIVEAVKLTTNAMGDTARRTGGKQAPAVLVMTVAAALAELLANAPNPDELAEKMINDCFRANATPRRLVRHNTTSH